MKLLLFILFLLLTIFGLNFVFIKFNMGIVMEFISIVLLYLFLIYVGVNFIKKDFKEVFDFNFAINFSLLFWGLIAMLGIRLIGTATDGVLLEFDSEYLVNLEQLTFLVLIYNIINAFFEEILIRKFLLNKLTIKYRPLKAVGISAIIFSVLHLYNGVDGLLMLFLMGLVLGYIYLLSKNWFLCFIIHFLYNCSINISDEMVIRGSGILSLSMYFYFGFVLIGIIILWYSVSVLRKKVKLLNLENEH